MGSPCDQIPAGAFASPHNLLNQIVGRLLGSTTDLKDYKTLADLKLGNWKEMLLLHACEHCYYCALLPN